MGFLINHIDGHRLGEVETDKLSFFRHMVLNLKNVEMRIICNIARIKQLPHSDEICDDTQPLVDGFKTLPPAKVNSILMFSIDGMIVNTGNWVLSQTLSDVLDKLVFYMTLPNGKIDYVGIDPIEIQKVQVRTIPINPYPEHHANFSEYGTLLQHRSTDVSPIVMAGNAWHCKTGLSQYMSKYLDEKEEQDVQMAQE